MAKKIVVTADKIYKRKKNIKRTKIISLIIFILMTIIFLILSVIFKGGRFVITLDNDLAQESSIVIFDDLVSKEGKRKLYADEMKHMDNISIKWLPKDINNEKDGAHNGENYIAYTFYIENRGEKSINYWYEIIIDDVIKNVDEAVRIMIYHNDEKEVYAKINNHTKLPELETKAFYTNDDKTAILENRKNFNPKDIDKFTIVVWLDGDDPDCVNAIIGGEIKLHMNIREEYVNDN